MAFIRFDGPQRSMPARIPKKASTAMAAHDVVISTSGEVDVAVASSILLLGIAMKAVTATDADYASTTSVELEAIDPNATYIADVGTGTATASMVGAQYDLKDKSSIDVTGTTYKQVKIVGFISGTKVLVKFNPNLL